MKKILYVGPSWAYRSFDSPEGSELEYTNLVQELNISVDNLSKSALSNLEIINQVIPKNYKDLYKGIIFVYSEPIGDLTSLQHYTTNLNHITPATFIESENFWEMRKEINRYVLTEMSQIECPIGLIGAHSDVEDCNYNNITVIHPSWQKFLAQYTSVTLEDGWGAEVAHRYIMTEYKDITPSRNIVNKISDTFSAWHKMELNRVFNWCHPNKKGNELFAKEIANSVQSFINNL
jgi:hypothetical protein